MEIGHLTESMEYGYHLNKLEWQYIKYCKMEYAGTNYQTTNFLENLTLSDGHKCYRHMPTKGGQQS